MKLTRVLVGAGKSQVNLGQLVNVCITNALARVTLGRRVVGDKFEFEGTDRKANEVEDMVRELMVLAGEFNLGDFIPVLEWLDLQGITKKMKKLHKRFDSFFNTILEEHKMGSGNVSGHGDFLSTLISLKDDADGEGGKLSDVEIKALLMVCLQSCLYSCRYKLLMFSVTC